MYHVNSDWWRWKNPFVPIANYQTINWSLFPLCNNRSVPRRRLSETQWLFREHSVFTISRSQEIESRIFYQTTWSTADYMEFTRYFGMKSIGHCGWSFAFFQWLQSKFRFHLIPLLQVSTNLEVRKLFHFTTHSLSVRTNFAMVIVIVIVQDSGTFNQLRWTHMEIEWLAMWWMQLPRRRTWRWALETLHREMPDRGRFTFLHWNRLTSTQSAVSRVQSAARNMETVMVDPLRRLISKISDRAERGKWKHEDAKEVGLVGLEPIWINEALWVPGHDHQT